MTATTHGAKRSNKSGEITTPIHVFLENLPQKRAAIRRTQTERGSSRSIDRELPLKPNR